MPWGVYGGKDLRRISLELRRQGNGREVAKKFRRELRRAAAPMVPAVRASIAQIPTHGDKHTGLRQRMSKATRLRVRTVGRGASVQILVDPKRMPDGEKSLPQYMEGAEGHTRWRHPVYGPRGSTPYVTQPPSPYFFRVVRPLGARSRVAVAKVVTEISREIT
jgi:hypothetical protein